MSSTPRIAPLPDSVRSRLRTSLNITTLPNVLSELLQNSIDAAANTLTISFNPSRSSFVVTDDGHGILSTDLSSLGTLYSTSKYPADLALFGCRGEALAAIATHSLLTITTRADGYRSTHTVRFSYGKKLFCGPAPEHLWLPNHGTVVRVEGLWADLPVRVKARERLDAEKEWEEIFRAVVELLLSGRAARVTSTVVRDQDGNRKLSVKSTDKEKEREREKAVLRQALGCKPDEWEWVKAKQGNVRIEGWIAIRPAPRRNKQFLFVNGYPLRRGANALAAAVDSVFAGSGFGVAEDGRSKAVEKWGMYVLRVECRRKGDLTLGGEGGTEGKAGVEGKNLGVATELLERLVREFLKMHHHKPLGSSKRKTLIVAETLVKAPVAPRRAPMTPPSDTDTEAAMIAENRMRDLDSWSKVKAARSDLAELSGRCSTTSNKTAPAPCPADTTVPDVPKSATPADDPAVNVVETTSGEIDLPGDGTEDTVSVAPAPAPTNLKRSSSALLPTNRLPLTTPKRLRTSTSFNPPSSSGGEWTYSLLSTWKNPVFAPPAEREIPQHALPSFPDSASALDSARLGTFTKEGLQKARFIAQVDSKYLLIKTFISTSGLPTEMLAVVDQHAASERIRVEELLEALLTPSQHPPHTLTSPMSLALEAHELTLLRKHRLVLESWNICLNPASTSPTLTALPSPLRNPPAPLQLIRRLLHNLPKSPPDEAVPWHHRLSTVPEPLMEAVNSKACRGAIMFGDAMGDEECEELLERWAACRWPWICAHGRVAVRPVIELGNLGGRGRDRGEEGFMEAWDKMRKRRKGGEKSGRESDKNRG